jgi:hypothetical protein
MVEPLLPVARGLICDGERDGDTHQAGNHGLLPGVAARDGGKGVEHVVLIGQLAPCVLRDLVLAPADHVHLAVVGVELHVEV